MPTASDLLAVARAEWRRADLAALEAECALKLAKRRLKHAADHLAELGGAMIVSAPVRAAKPASVGTQLAIPFEEAAASAAASRAAEVAPVPVEQPAAPLVPAAEPTPELPPPQPVHEIPLSAIPGLTANVLKKLAGAGVKTVGDLHTWCDDVGDLGGGMCDSNGVGLMSALQTIGVGQRPASAAGDAVYAFLRQHGCDPRPVEEPEPEDEVAPRWATLDDGLLHAIHSMQGCAERWEARIATGLSDDGLREAVGYEFGIEGGAGGPGTTPVRYKGGKNPQFWYGDSKKPTLSGKALLTKVRELTGVGPVKTGSPLDDIAKNAVPRAELQKAYRNVAKSTDLHAHGYSISHWHKPTDPADQVVEYNPRSVPGKPSDKPRLTARTFEEQQAIHDALGVPVSGPGLASPTAKPSVAPVSLPVIEAPATAPVATPVPVEVPATKLSEIDNVPDAVLDACLLKGITTLPTLVERMAIEQPQLAERPLRNRLVADAIAAHVAKSGAAAAEVVAAESPKAEPAPAPAADPHEPVEPEHADRTAQWWWWSEHKRSEIHDRGQAFTRIRHAIAECREDQANDNAHPMWGSWSEFKVDGPGGEQVTVLSKPRWDGVNDRHHVDFIHAGDDLGHWTEIVTGGAGQHGVLIEWARAQVELRVRLTSNRPTELTPEPAPAPAKKGRGKGKGAK